MGRRPNLPQVERLLGNPTKRPIKDPVVEATGAVVVATHLDKAARQCVEIIRSSMPPTVFAACDSFLIAAYATSWSLHRQATIAINSPGFEYIVQTRAARRPNPWIFILNSQALMMANLGAKLGPDPVARSRLHLPEDKPPSKFAALTERAH